MLTLTQQYFPNKKAFRSWLSENHDKSPGIWLVFYKKQIKIECIDYKDALEEALCFGWIDSIIKKIDDEKYVRKFTPRTDTSKWSEVNKKIVTALINEGRMTEFGLKKIDVYLKTGKVEWSSKEEEKKDSKSFTVPESMINVFAKNEPALTNFNGLAQTYKRHYVLWITSAKQEETIQRRLKEAIELLKQNKKLTLK